MLMIVYIQSGMRIQYYLNYNSTEAYPSMLITNGNNAVTIFLNAKESGHRDTVNRTK